MTDIVRGMAAVHTDRMKRNLELTKGLVFSGQLLLELTARGMARAGRPTAWCSTTPWRPGSTRATSSSGWPSTPRYGRC
jgi:hypothetical protein